VYLKDKASSDASDVSDAYWGLPHVPVDPIKIATDLGIIVNFQVLDNGISGMLAAVPDEPPVMYINSTDTPQRQRFTIAHEIGHYYERTGNGQRDFGFIDAKRGGKYDIHEYYADVFAASLLMPEQLVREQASKGISLAGLAAHFDVSISAMQLRLSRLGIKLR